MKISISIFYFMYNFLTAVLHYNAFYLPLLDKLGEMES